jgi:hypothetical protein
MVSWISNGQVQNLHNNIIKKEGESTLRVLSLSNPVNL